MGRISFGRRLGVLLVALLLAQGCRGTQSAATGGGGWNTEGKPTAPEGATQEEAHQAEADAALELVWSLAKGQREVGTRLVFTFWAQKGALTLLRYREHLGRGEGRAVNEESFSRQLRPFFVEYMRGHVGEAVLTLNRAESSWAVDYDANSVSARPSEAKTLPVNRPSLPAHASAKALEVAAGMARVLPVPANGVATLLVDVALVDERITRWEHRGFQVLERGGSPQSLSQESVERLAHVLRSFTEGVGQRTVSLEIKGAHREGEPTARAQVTEAHALSAAPPYKEDPEVAAEYRALHEDILRRWREGVRDGAELLARYSVEQLALWYVGSIFTRGAGLLFEAAAPTVTRVLTRGGAEAAGWLRTALFRIPKTERATFNNLWLKVQMEGAEALSKAEKNELLLLMNRVEWLVRSPLDREEKEILRSAARRYYKKFQSGLTESMRLKGSYEVHHRRPLEYAHLFPEKDSNASANLKGVGEEVHQHINGIWTEFRSRRPNATAEEVDKVVAIIDGHFGRWYDVTYSADESAAALGEAIKAARRGLDDYFPGR